MTLADYRAALAWAIVHADGKNTWQLRVYEVIGTLSLTRPRLRMRSRSPISATARTSARWGRFGQATAASRGAFRSSRPRRSSGRVAAMRGGRNCGPCVAP